MANKGVFVLYLCAGFVMSINAATQPNTVIDYPGTYPGTALATLSSSTFELSNDILYMSWNFSGKIFSLAQFTNKMTSTAIALSTVNLFSLTLQNSTVITPGSSSVTLQSGPTLTSLVGDTSARRMSERDNGKQISAVFRYTGASVTFDITWRIILRDGNCNVQQRLVLTPVSGNLSLKYAKMIDVTLSGASTLGVDSGKTIVAGNVFMGMENPMASVSISGTAVGALVEKANDTTAIGDSLVYTASTGIVPSNQMRRGFLYYMERERVHYRRPYLIYVSWFDLVGGGSGGGHSTANCTRVIRSVDTQLVTKRSTPFDAFLWDDNWDNVSASPVWSISTTMFPDSFRTMKNVAAQYSSKLGVWFSPFGGYGSNASTRAASNPTMETSGGQFVFSGTRYNAAVRTMATNMVDSQGVNIFKIDGIGGGLYQAGPSATNRKDYEALLKFAQYMRQRKPDVFLYFTVGTWSSPYWYWFADAIYRDHNDQPYALTGNNRQQLISGRDLAIYTYNVQQNILHPLSELMSHGFVFTVSTSNGSPASTTLTDSATRKETKEDMKWYFASGFALEEMYIAVNVIGTNSFFWDCLARYATWARQNIDILTDSRMIGSPAAGSVYGYASYSPARSIYSVRNPNSAALNYAVNPQTLFVLPGDTTQSYLFTEIDGLTGNFTASRASPYTITVPAYSVYVFQATPVVAVKNSIASMTSKKPITFFINHSNTVIRFSCSFPAQTSLRLTTLTGRTVFQTAFKGSSVQLRKPLPSGVIICEICSSDIRTRGLLMVK